MGKRWQLYSWKGVYHATPIWISQLINEKMDFFVPIFAWHSTVAGTTDASIIGIGCRNRYWSVYCVSTPTYL